MLEHLTNHIKQTDIPFSACMINDIYLRLWNVYVITIAYFNGGLIKPKSIVGHEWVITSNRKLWDLFPYSYHDIW